MFGIPLKFLGTNERLREKYARLVSGRQGELFSVYIPPTARSELSLETSANIYGLRKTLSIIGVLRISSRMYKTSISFIGIENLLAEVEGAAATNTIIKTLEEASTAEIQMFVTLRTLRELRSQIGKARGTEVYGYASYMGSNKRELSAYVKNSDEPSRTFISDHIAMRKLYDWGYYEEFERNIEGIDLEYTREDVRRLVKRCFGRS